MTKVKRILPTWWFGAKAMAVYPDILATKKAKLTDIDINHERIHLRQQAEMLVLPFVIWYFTEWAVKSLIGWKDAYRDISFEREAYENERDLGYLSNRKTPKRAHYARISIALVLGSILSIWLMKYV